MHVRSLGESAAMKSTHEVLKRESKTPCRLRALVDEVQLERCVGFETHPFHNALSESSQVHQLRVQVCVQTLGVVARLLSTRASLAMPTQTHVISNPLRVLAKQRVTHTIDCSERIRETT
jgi:hypothetical protein